jgi:hypothetical protein
MSLTKIVLGALAFLLIGAVVWYVTGNAGFGSLAGAAVALLFGRKPSEKRLAKAVRELKRDQADAMRAAEDAGDAAAKHAHDEWDATDKERQDVTSSTDLVGYLRDRDTRANSDD